jgi:lipopolysaccharide export system protein LptC
MLITLVLALLAAVTWFASWQPTGPAPAVPTDAESRPLGYYLRDARLVGTDEQGRVSYRLSAERLDEVPNEERLRLEGVSLEYTPADETAWQISAGLGTAPKDRSQLTFAGEVELRSSPTDGSAPVIITTAKLEFWPDTSSAESDEPVTIRVGDWHLAAVGLRTYLKGDTLQLESEVHGTLAPQ